MVLLCNEKVYIAKIIILKNKNKIEKINKINVYTYSISFVKIKKSECNRRII